MNETKNKKKILPWIVVAGVVILPLLYSLFYLDAFWDPYSRLDDVPVALVNEDIGATINGETRNVGQEICDALLDEDTLNFVLTDAKTAESGTEGTKYYATITIPSNFSESISSASELDKQTAIITYTSNEKRNYLASQILNNAVSRVEKSVRSSVDKAIVAELSDKLESSPGQLSELSQGLSQLHAGSTTLKDGTSKLADGATTLQSGVSQLSTGALTLKDGSANLASGTATLSSGASQVASGSSALSSGLSTFSTNFGTYQTGINTAATGAATLSTNLTSLDTGISTLLTGATTLETSTANLNQLQLGAESLASGASTFNDSLILYISGVDSLVESVNTTKSTLALSSVASTDPYVSAVLANLNSTETTTQLETLTAASTSLKTASSNIVAGTATIKSGTANMTQLQAAITQIKNGLITAKAGSSALSNGAATLNAGMSGISTATTQLATATNTLTTGAATLNTGISSLQSGVTKIDSGAASLSSGASALYDGTTALKTGTNDLITGTSALDDGAIKLNDGLNTASTGLDTSLEDINDQLKTLDGLDEYAANPVTVDTKPYAAVPNYGTAFAPYFMSLSLWVGALLIFIGIYYDPDEKFKVLSRHSDRRQLRSFCFLGIGFLQAIILDLALVFILGLKLNNPILFFASTALVSVVFVSIVQLFMVFLGDAGKFISMVLLILQLTSCAGTFPMETIPKIFNYLYPFMPMTYSVKLFKEAISGVDGSSIAFENTAILFGILVVTMTITILCSRAKKRIDAAKYQELEA